MYFLGIDVGSLSCDAVLIDESKKVVAWSVVPTGVRNLAAIDRAKAKVLDRAGILETDLKAIISTGYGRNRVANRTSAVTEITCHARGIQEVIPGTRILIDIGGQDSKVIYMGENGKVLDFAMNDKCAAGTGRFLEAMARALEVDILDLGDLDTGAGSDLILSSMCTVFAESEVVSLIAEGTDQREIAKGLNRSIASRIYALVKRVAKNIDDLTVSMSGGVAWNRGVVRALEEILKVDRIQIPENPDTIGALGAALIARERVEQ
ncbi:MAG: acyl-CoA dehydratase activase [Desulfobacterium sp.]|jgi:predicted CoA-substrate-specific enzyme activase|nr:acyl-CoA dehydratase activase [Desulfobacterium sp.]